MTGGTFLPGPDLKAMSVVLGIVVAAVGFVSIAAAILGPTTTPAIQPARTMRCFPEGTHLPFRADIFGGEHPSLPGCVDYRLNEGMEA